MDFKGQRVGALWPDHPGPKKKFRSLEARIFESSRLEGLLGLLGLLEGGWNNEVEHARCSGEIGGLVLRSSPSRISPNCVDSIRKHDAGAVFFA